MSGLTTENWVALIGTALFFIWGIAVFLFGRISVKHIEQEMAKEGLSPPTWDSGIGGRVIMYAMVIVAKKAAKSSPVDDEAVLRHTRKKDYCLAMFYMVSAAAMFTVAFIAYFLYGADV